MVNIGSGCLTPTQNTFVFGLLDLNSHTISTAIVKLQSSTSLVRSRRDSPQIACIVRDNKRRKYFIQVFDVFKKCRILEIDLNIHLEYKTSERFLHHFKQMDQYCVLKFWSLVESMDFKAKIEKRLYTEKIEIPYLPSGPPRFVRTREPSRPVSILDETISTFGNLILAEPLSPELLHIGKNDDQMLKPHSHIGSIFPEKNLGKSSGLTNPKPPIPPKSQNLRQSVKPHLSTFYLEKTLGNKTNKPSPRRPPSSKPEKKIYPEKSPSYNQSSALSKETTLTPPLDISSNPFSSDNLPPLPPPPHHVHPVLKIAGNPHQRGDLMKAIRNAGGIPAASLNSIQDIQRSDKLPQVLPPPPPRKQPDIGGNPPVSPKQPTNQPDPENPRGVLMKAIRNAGGIPAARLRPVQDIQRPGENDLQSALMDRLAHIAAAVQSDDEESLYCDDWDD